MITVKMSWDRALSWYSVNLGHGLEMAGHLARYWGKDLAQLLVRFSRIELFVLVELHLSRD